MRAISRLSPARRTGIGLTCVVVLLAGCSGRGADDGPSTASGDPTTGITDDEVVVGNVSAVSGPIPGLFQGAPDGVEAYFAKVNADGGVHGRQLRLISKDDALNCNQNATATRELAGQVAAFVNSYSVFDGCGAEELAKYSDLADVSNGVDARVTQREQNFSPSPAPAGSRTGGFIYYRDTFGVKTIGSIYGNGAAESSWREQIAALESVGYELGYARGIAASETDFTADIIRMRDANVDFLYLNAVNASVLALVLKQAKQQDWRPKVIASGVAYDGEFFDLLDDPSAAEGLFFDSSSAMFLGEDRDTVPQVGEFLDWMEKANPDAVPDLFAMYGWVSAMLFVQALEAAGEDPTRQDIVDALGEIDSFDADGMLSGADVAAKEPSECYLLGQVQDGKYVRVLPEDEGFTCEPGGYYFDDGS